MVAAQERITGAENIVWDLTHLYANPDDPAIDADMQKLVEMAETFSQTYKGRVGTLTGAELAEAVRQTEALYDGMGRLSAFADLLYSTQTDNPRYGALAQRMTEFLSSVSQKIVFFDLEWAQADDGHQEEVLAEPALAQYRHYLEAQLRYKRHQLDEGREQLIIEKDVTGRTAWERLFLQIMGAMRFDLNGEALNQSQMLSLLSEADRELRQQAADTFTEGLRTRQMELTFIMNTILADKGINDRLRHYSTWVSDRNLANKAPDSVVEALIKAVTDRYDLVARHYTLKKRLLGLDELYDYDRYAPLPLSTSDKIYTWDEAREIVLNAFESFHPEMRTLAQRFFDENWIHAALGPSKRGGAFAHPVTPSVHPYVFTNYNGKADDVSTLAHELGHGLHMVLSGQQSGLFGLYTPLTTAEMASIFAEMIVFNDLMQREPDPEVRLGMLLEKVEGSFKSVFRQIAMNRFEERVHNARREQGELTTEQINAIWLETQNDQFQGSVNLRDQYGLWWSYIPHFINTPGYVYAYAFGELLVLALYNLYQQQGAPFAEKYLQVLAAGNSDYPDRILASLGVDLNDPGFWHEGLNAIEKLIEREEALAREVYPEKFA
ncbi:MAG: M3 family oligoendopeptidase [Anaerolineae bacterium]